MSWSILFGITGFKQIAVMRIASMDSHTMRSSCVCDFSSDRVARSHGCECCMKALVSG